MSLYRAYRDDETHFIVSADGTLKKYCRWRDQDTWLEEFQPVPQDEMVKTWEEIVDRMVERARK